MSTALQKTNQPSKPSALAAMASRLNVEPAKMLSTLKGTVFAKATEEEMMALCVVANEYELNPFLKEIYAFPAKGGGIVPIISVDGWNKMMVRHPDFDGIAFEFGEVDGKLQSCTATVHFKQRKHPVVITEFYDECKRNTDPWNNMPRRMLRNRTLCQAARVAFGFTGATHEDDTAGVIDVTSSVVSDEPAKLPAPAVEPSPQTVLQALVLDGGFSFDQFRKWGIESGNVTNADSIATFGEIPAAEAKRIAGAGQGLIKQLKQMFP